MNNKNVKPKRKNREKSFMHSANSKVFGLFFFLAFFFVIIVVKLFFINFVQGEELTKSALNQLTKSETVDADRGIIYDRNKKELVLNITKSNIYYNMDFNKENYTNVSDYERVVEEKTTEDAEKIAQVLGKETEEIKKLLTGERVVKIASNVSLEVASELKDLGLARLSIDDVVQRYYPYSTLASSVLGFVIDGVGQYGIESKYDSDLSGIAGKNISVKSNSLSQIPLTDEETYAPKEGMSVVLTVDESIQQFAEEAASSARIEHNAEKVSIIVQDTNTGEILAMVNSESYDLNNPKEPIGEYYIENWNDLTEEEQLEHWYSNWNNFCVNSQYEPGSTFKLITAAAALEEATTSLNSTYVCNGVYEIADRIITCTADARGQRTLEQAVAESCNIAFVQIGRDLGAERMLKYINAFGFGEKTGIDLPAEASGSIPSSASELTAVKLATVSYGHGIAVTPIQLINSVSAIVNGGYLNTPRIVSRLEDSSGNVIKSYETETKRRVISEETSNTMKYLMRKVVDEGTGRRAQIEGYQIGGKTGTANVVLENGLGYDPNNYISSFVGVAPLNDPKITVLVIVQKPQGEIFGSTVAVPAGRDVIAKSLDYLGIEPTEKITTNEDAELVLVPDVKNYLLADAGKTLVDLGLQFNVSTQTVSDSAVIIGQSPKAGSYVEAGTIIDLNINNNDTNEKIMPDLYGKSKEDAETILKSLNINYNIDGSGSVISQSISAGDSINEESSIKIGMSITDSNEIDLDIED